MVKNLSARARDSALGRVDPLEEVMAAHSGILAWEIPWTEEPGGLWGHKGSKELNTTQQLTLFTFFQKFMLCAAGHLSHIFTLFKDAFLLARLI